MTLITSPPKEKWMVLVLKERRHLLISLIAKTGAQRRGSDHKFESWSLCCSCASGQLGVISLGRLVSTVVLAKTAPWRDPTLLTLVKQASFSSKFRGGKHCDVSCNILCMSPGISHVYPEEERQHFIRDRVTANSITRCYIQEDQTKTKYCILRLLVET